MASPHVPRDYQNDLLRLVTLRNLLDKSTSGSSPSIPGLVYQAVDRNGDILFSYASGRRGLTTSSSPMTVDTVFWLASCTKMITGIACMQLVEQGRLALDDVEQLERLAPELKEVKVLRGDVKNGFEMVDKDRGITLRMLLSHTAGFGYPFSHTQLRDYSLPIGYDEFAGHTDSVLGLPLIHHPGTQFDYGVNIDWAGVLVERVSGLSLNEYFRKHIFEPLGIEDISFFPNKGMKSRLAYTHRRDTVDGSLHVIDHIYRFPLVERQHSDLPEERFCSGGAGCFGTVVDYCTIISVLLNNGTCPKASAQILKPETVDEMFTDQIPTIPRYINKPAESAKPHLAKPSPVRPLVNPAQEESITEGWGLTFALNHTTKDTGRKPASASWEGIANLFWWADRESGVGGMIASQILPYGDTAVMDVNDAAEKWVYEGLNGTEKNTS